MNLTYLTLMTSENLPDFTVQNFVGMSKLGKVLVTPCGSPASTEAMNFGRGRTWASTYVYPLAVLPLGGLVHTEM